MGDLDTGLEGARTEALKHLSALTLTSDQWAGLVTLASLVDEGAPVPPATLAKVFNQAGPAAHHSDPQGSPISESQVRGIRITILGRA